MAHYQQKDDRDVIKVKWDGITYKASLDGERTSCTASAEMAARRLGAKVMDVPCDQVHLKELPDDRRDYFKFEIVNLN